MSRCAAIRTLFHQGNRWARKRSLIILKALSRFKETNLINDVSKFRYFSKFDIRNTYHQIPLHPQDMKSTAFEANGMLFHFQRIPLGLTNALGAFQRIITQIIQEDLL